MGSYLTIVNNTPYTWQCKVGIDTAALKMSGFGIGVIAAGLTALALTAAVLTLVTVTAIPLVFATTLGIFMAMPYISVIGTGLPLISGVPIAGAATGVAVVAAIPNGLYILGSGMGATNLVAGVTAGTAALAAAGASVAGAAGLTPFGIAVAKAVRDKLHMNQYDTLKPGEKHRYGKMTLSLWQQCECKTTNTAGPYVVVDTLIMRPIFSGSTINSNRDHDIQYWIDKHGITSKYSIQGKYANKTRSLEEDNEAIQHYQFFPNGTAFNTATGALCTE